MHADIIQENNLTHIWMDDRLWMGKLSTKFLNLLCLGPISS